LITSACTGWRANAAEFASSDNILRAMENHPVILVAETNADTTFGSQSTFVLPRRAEPTILIFMPTLESAKSFRLAIRLAAVHDENKTAHSQSNGATAGVFSTFENDDIFSRPSRRITD